MCASEFTRRTIGDAYTILGLFLAFPVPLAEAFLRWVGTPPPDAAQRIGSPHREPSRLPRHLTCGSASGAPRCLRPSCWLHRCWASVAPETGPTGVEGRSGAAVRSTDVAGRYDAYFFSRLNTAMPQCSLLGPEAETKSQPPATLLLIAFPSSS